MARIALHIETPAARMTLKAMLEAAGHQIVTAEPELIFADTPARAAENAAACPVLLLAAAAQIPEAVNAMRQGAYGYVFLPLQPGEAVMMVARALAQQPSRAREEAILTLEEAETRHIRETLRRCHHNQADAARRLGIGRNTLWRKMKKMGDQDLS